MKWETLTEYTQQQQKPKKEEKQPTHPKFAFEICRAQKIIYTHNRLHLLLFTFASPNKNFPKNNKLHFCWENILLSSHFFAFVFSEGKKRLYTRKKNNVFFRWIPTNIHTSILFKRLRHWRGWRFFFVRGFAFFPWGILQIVEF